MVAPASTFTLLGMALEEKPRLGRGAVASYKKAPGTDERRRRGMAMTSDWVLDDLDFYFCWFYI